MSLERSKGALQTLQERIASNAAPRRSTGILRVYRGAVALIVAICTSIGCATADFHGAPNRTLISQPSQTPFHVPQECIKLHAKPKRPDDTPAEFWQETAAQHLRKCGKFITFDHLNTLTRIPTIGGDRTEMLSARRYLSDWATAHHIDFSTVGDDTLWTFEVGSGDYLMDMITHLDIRQGRSTLALSLMKRVPAYQATLELDRIYGRGVRDNKAGIAAAMSLLESLALSRDRLPGIFRLVVVLQSYLPDPETAKWAARIDAAAVRLVLDSYFPVSLGTFGSSELRLKFAATEHRPTEHAAWRIVAMGAGQSSSRIAANAMIALQVHPGLAEVFDEVARDVENVAEVTMGSFGDDFSLDLQPLPERGQLGLRIGGKESHAADPARGSNPLSLLAAIASQLDVASGHGRAALEFIASELNSGPSAENLGIISDNRRGFRFSVAPTTLRHTKTETLLQIYLAYPGTVSKDRHRFQKAFQKQIKASIWSHIDVENVREAIDGTFVSTTDPKALLAVRIAQEHLPESGREPVVERSSSLLPLFPGAIGFGPSQNDSIGNQPDSPESIPVKLVETWPLMLLDFATRVDEARGLIQ